MKKLLIISSLIVSLTAASAHAKTEGSYLGIDLLKTNTQVKGTGVGEDYGVGWFNTKAKDSSIGFGINYKYAINMNNFFIAPGLFYESIGAEAEASNKDGIYTYTQKTKINDRYGVKLDLGYDIMDKFAAYIPLGLTSTNYELSTKDSAGSSYRSTKTSGSDIGILYGVGFAFYPMEKLAISLEYNRSKIDLKSGGNVNLFDQTTLKTKANLDVIKIGVSYKF